MLRLGGAMTYSQLLELDMAEYDEIVRQLKAEQK